MLLKDRRRARRLAIDIDADLRPIEFNAIRSLSGPPIRAKVSNVGPTGIMVDRPAEEPPGSRFRVSLDLEGDKLDFFAIVRHVTIVVTESQPIYAHGLQITAAADDDVAAIERFLERRAAPQRIPAKGTVAVGDIARRGVASSRLTTSGAV
jgi:hypothetical protein